MKYLPFENYVLITDLSVEEVRKRLSDIIKQKKKISTADFQSTQKPYEGSLTGDTFTMSRIINNRNSFLPIITGHISQVFGQTEIKIKMRPVIFVLIFMSIWLGGVGLFCIGVLIAGIIKIKEILQHGFSPMILIPFGMFIFGYGLAIVGFKFESSDSKKFLATLFEAQYKETAE